MTKELRLENVRVIKVGSIYRIHPSATWANIEDGVIKIVKIVTPEEKDYEKDNVQIEMLDFCNTEEEKALYTNCNWIGYEHKDRYGFSCRGNFYMIPDWLFADHISCY